MKPKGPTANVGGIDTDIIAEAAATNDAVRAEVEALVKLALREVRKQLTTGTPEAKVRIAQGVLIPLMKTLGDTEAQLERQRVLKEWEDLKRKLLGLDDPTQPVTAPLRTLPTTLATFPTSAPA